MFEDTYQVVRSSQDEVKNALSTLLNLSFNERQSSYVGRYFKVVHEGTEIAIKLNWLDDGELVVPRLPEGLFVYVTGKDEQHLFRDRLETLPDLVLLESVKF
jgi:hypothetical protein